jgi:dipeptidyl aminopeptidase/acylaminoacyl peptidase
MRPAGHNARRGGGLAALLVALALLACREVGPFESMHRPPPGDPPWRLTFNPGDDRAPAWSPAGDSVYYSADGFDDLPPIRDLLLRVPRAGGTAELLLADVQTAVTSDRRLPSVAPSPDGGRIAYAQLWNVYEDEGTEGCPLGWVCSSPDTVGSIPPLGSVMCRVRAAQGGGSIEDDPALRIDFAGWSIVDNGQVPPLELLESHPFQVLYALERARIFRPTWAPDGERVALSDGLRLLVWRVGEAQAVPIPGTEDGVGPAWSPDGDWIAYTYLERGASRTFTCVCPTAFGVSRRQERTVYEVVSRRVRLVRPDGSEQIDLAEGEDPAWTPDGSAIVFSAGNRLWRIGRDGSGLAEIPGTVGGREPAVSPDGRYLTFALGNAIGMHDVWVVSLDSGQ